ncbi:hypothetical protein [Polaromonas sp. C04]|uniref:hypothetical protein n=1 Tax=Polaromonas sp. C04 TaxID=1945857 RepID=UPI00098495F8|nr:hypothetical protein [Polaromonas sp. C04]OOG52181.1 hypothetical protein B0E49_12430 [Polaromonas sp. C04]
MTAKNLSTVVTDLIESYGNTSKNVINAYRTGGERIVGFVEQRWDRALEASSPKLSADVVENATAAQKLVGSYYAQGLALATNSADTLVNEIVKFAGQGVQQVAANASRFEEKTGVPALSKLATAAVPAAEMVSKLAAQLEEKSAELVKKIAGDDAASVKHVSPFKKARATKAA